MRRPRVRPTRTSRVPNRSKSHKDTAKHSARYIPDDGAPLTLDYDGIEGVEVSWDKVPFGSPDFRYARGRDYMGHPGFWMQHPSDYGSRHGWLFAAPLNAKARAVTWESDDRDLGRPGALRSLLRLPFRTLNPGKSTVVRTHPQLWEEIVAYVKAGDKGGRPGQWSARKAQLAVQIYRQEGGGYIGRKTSDNSLVRWTEQDWRTASGRPSLETGERYLPAAAFDALTEEEIDETNKAKRRGMRRGKQFVPQPDEIAAKTAKFRRK